VSDWFVSLITIHYIKYTVSNRSLLSASVASSSAKTKIKVQSKFQVGLRFFGRYPAMGVDPLGYCRSVMELSVGPVRKLDRRHPS